MKYVMIFICLVSFTVYSADILITDNSINANDKVTWTADNTYILNGWVFVEAGAELHIEPGVVIKGKPGEGRDASSLIICKDAKIFAEGTRDKPIVFTAFIDDLKPYGEGVMLSQLQMLWGGLIILGKAKISGLGTAFFEALDASDPRNSYGGNDDNDNSGIIRYVSLRYGGKTMLADKEINGLTMCGVGRGTTIEYVEVYNNSDDAFEWFGGSVNTRYLVAVNCNDDAFDYDEGFHGVGQFWCCLHGNSSESSRCGEHSGGPSAPFSLATVANVTYITKGGSPPPGTLYFDQNAGGKYYNSIFYETGDVQFKSGSENRYNAGDIIIANSLFWSKNVGRPARWTTFCLGTTSSPSCKALNSNGNEMVDPKLVNGGISSGFYNKLYDYRPSDSSALKNLFPIPTLNQEFLVPVKYKGAFSPWEDTMWVKGWTALDFYGYLSDNYQAPFDPPENPVTIKEYISLQEPIETSLIYIKNNTVYIPKNNTNDKPVGIELFNLAGERIDNVIIDRTSQNQTTLKLNATRIGTCICRVRYGSGTVRTAKLIIR